MLSRVTKGIIAGLLATAVVSGLEVANQVFGPWFSSFPRILSYMLQQPDNAALGWGVHIAVGTLVLGPAFAWACPRLPTDTAQTKGIVFTVGVWLLMMMTVAPLAGLGFFAARADFPTIAWMLGTHIVFGAVLGGVYGWLSGKDRAAVRMPRTRPTAAA